MLTASELKAALLRGALRSLEEVLLPAFHIDLVNRLAGFGGQSTSSFFVFDLCCISFVFDFVFYLCSIDVCVA